MNKVVLIGNVGNDPELKQLNDKNCVCRMSLATSKKISQKNEGLNNGTSGVQDEKKEITQWHQVVFWNEKAKLVQQYVKKGAKIYVEGELTYNKWEDTSGVKREKAEIIVSNVIFLNQKKEDAPVNTDTMPESSNAVSNDEEVF